MAITTPSRSGIWLRSYYGTASWSLPFLSWQRPGDDLRLYGVPKQIRIPTVQATILNRSLLFGAATAITTLAFLTVAAPVHAAPNPCSQYAFNGNFVIRGDNIGEVTVDAATGPKFVGQALAVADDGRAVYGFVKDGGIQGRNVDFTISWIEESDTTWTFSGTVADDGLVHRGVMHGPGFMSLWESTRPLACNDAEIATKPLPGSVITPPAPATTRVPGPITAP